MWNLKEYEQCLKNVEQALLSPWPKEHEDRFAAQRHVCLERIADIRSEKLNPNEILEEVEEVTDTANGNESRVPVESKSAELLKLLRSKPNIIDDVKPTDIFSKLFAEANQLSMQFESELAFLHHGKEKLRNILSCSSSSQPHLLYCLQNQLELNNKTFFYPGKTSKPYMRFSVHAHTMAGKYNYEKSVVELREKCNGVNFYASTFELQLRRTKSQRWQ